MKTFTLKDTKNPFLKRIVDREDNWKHYLLDHPKLGKHVLRGVTTILKEGYLKGEGFNNFLANHTAAEREEIMRSTGERGDKVHRAIDWILSSAGSIKTLDRNVGIYSKEKKDYEKIENDEWDALLAWSRFWIAHEPILIAGEEPLYSIAFGYAGTTDAILILQKECGNRYCNCKGLSGKIGVWDWKTSAGIYPDHSAQVAAYANAENIVEFVPPHGTIDYIAILRLGTKHTTTGGYYVKAFERFVFAENEFPNELSENRRVQFKNSLDMAWYRFLSAQKLADFEYKPFDIEKDIEEIPDVIEVRVNRPADTFFNQPPVQHAAANPDAKVEKKPKTKKDGKSQGSRKGAKRAPKAPARQ